MAQSNPLYSTITLRRNAEECPLLIKDDINAPDWFCGTFEAEFEISVELDDPTQWWISDVWLVCDNGKMGKEAAGNIINLDADKDRHFYLMILDSIDRHYGRFVPEWIEDEIASLGIVTLYGRVA